MKEFDFKPQGTCSSNIHIVLRDDECIEDIVITRGCDGTSKGLAALARGRSAWEVRDLLKGITCKKNKTSCPDQTAKALTMMLEEISVSAAAD